MEFREGASVYTDDDEEMGKLSKIVLDPISRKVTHIVVEKGVLFPEDKVVPIDMVDTSREDREVLEPGIENFDDLAPFEEAHYVGVDDVERNRTSVTTPGPVYDYMPAYYFYPPYSGFPGYTSYPYVMPTVEVERNIPKNTIPLQEGVEVVSADGDKVGKVERIIVDQETDQATHFLISSGFLFKERKLVPINWVEYIYEDLITLGVGTGILEKLPDYKEE